MHTVGIDIGATKISFVLMENRKVLETNKIFTPKTRKELINYIVSQVKQWKKVSRIGIGAPGPLNKKGDLILNPPNIKILRNCPLAKIIEKKLGIKTKMDRDGNCFALGEALLGAGRGAKSVLGVTLGTGTGGGVVIRDRIYRGAFGAAGEVGHISIKFDGQKCSCGSYGCLEEYASSRFFFKKGFHPLEFEKRAQKGDKQALKVYNEYGRYLGVGLSSAINLLDPEIIVIGGGISNAYKFFIKETEGAIINKALSPLSKKNVKIKKAALGDFGGAVGAALLWQK